MKLEGFQVLRFGPHPDELLKKFKAEKVGIELRADPKCFAQLLAKIAYAFAVAQLNGRRFKDVYVRPVIFGDMTSAGRWIGSSERVLSPEPDDFQHSMQMKTFRTSSQQDSAEIAIVLVKLFANVPSPGYSIIVGELE
jgi:hypothetical protein